MDDEASLSQEGVKQVGKFLDGISRGAITELSQLLGQQVAYWRFKNAVTIALKAQNFLASKGLEPQQLSAELRVIVPLLESASYEDEPELQKMWASLLAASISPEFDSSMHPKYSEVLKQISPLEARLLKDIYEFNQRSGYWIYAHLDAIDEIAKIPIEKLQPFFINLDRLNLIRASLGKNEDGRYQATDVVISPFLVNFMERCIYVDE